ncbi:MAG TPA: creatininase family protein [Candidatus Nitrosotenuis sp.]|nr:creatininase family protein [Candidatus Nitrosotenuis sp.]
MILQDFSDPALRRLKGKKTVLIPVGSLEQHGPHLPVSTDSDIVSEIARQVAKRCGLWLLPTISYGVSFEHAPFFNLSVRAAILQQFLYDVCVSLAKNGMSRIIILNGHHGNQKALKALKSKIDKKHRGRIRVFVYSYWHFIGREFDHAGFVETSLMLAISDKPNMKLARKGLTTQNMTKQQKSRISKLASVQFIKATKNGVWGDPRNATRRDGRQILAEIVKNITKTVSKLA